MDDLFQEFDTLNLYVGDFGITYRGVLITNVVKKDPETGEIGLFAGDPYKDKYAEELFPEKSEFQSIIEQIEDNF